MFDDLVLLAKGGLTVYHGSVKKVEEYFAGLGIIIPERINPPDYFIDILEGMIAVPGGSSGVSYKELSIRWMLYNNYQIPSDMQQINESSFDVSLQSVYTANEQTIAGELWQDVKHSVELQSEKIRLNYYSKSKELSNRKTPGVFKQYKYFLIR